MPVVSRFFGIVVMMYYNDHHPPHFHARYGNDRAVISIDSLTILAGKLPPRVLGLLTEWGSMHRGELLENWNLARARAPLKPIDPLR
jgi:hypothetical protein